MSVMTSNLFGATTSKDPADLASHTVQGVSPASVVTPMDTAQISATLRHAAAHKLTVVPCGGMTSQGKGAPPQPGFIALKTSQLNTVFQHEPGDMVATAGGGMTVEDFQTRVRAAGQWLPIDAPAGATIGGIIAADVHGPRSYGYGRLRDMVLGMTVVNGDGVMRKCGSKVVKSVTGYSLEKLYIGSLGTLGIVTEATFKLRPLSIGGRFFQEQCATLDAGLEALAAVTARNLPLEMVQLVNTERSATLQPVLYVSAAGTEVELDRIEAELRLAVPSLAWKPLCYNPASPQSRTEWVYAQSHLEGAREMVLLDSARQRSTQGATLRFGCVRSKLKQACAAILERIGGVPVSLGVEGGIAELYPLSAGDAAAVGAALDSLGVNFAFENVVGIAIAERFGKARAERELMRQIKRALDPAGILNTGRFVV